LLAEIGETTGAALALGEGTAEAVGVEFARPPAVLARTAFVASEDFFAVEAGIGFGDAVVVGETVWALHWPSLSSHSRP
jgi:hypothetical protein